MDKIYTDAYHFCSIFNNFKQMKIDFGKCSIQFLFFWITEKLKIEFLAIFNLVVSFLQNGKSNSMPSNKNFYFWIWVLDHIMTLEF